MCRLWKIDSEALGSVDDLQLGSSPTTARPPPVRETPTKLPWRSASTARSRPGALPYQMPMRAVVPRARQRARELAAPRGGGAELLVQAGDVEDVVVRADPAVALKLLVQAAERRALVAGDHRAGVQAAAAVGAVLVERQAHERLDAGEEDPPLLEQVLVVERDLAPLRPAVATVASERLAPSRKPVAWRRDGHAALLRSTIGKRTLPVGENGNQRLSVRSRRLNTQDAGYKVNVCDHYYPDRIPANRSGPGRRRSRASPGPAGSRQRAPADRGGPLHGARPLARRHAAAALSRRAARGARRRNGPLAHDDPEGVGRRPRPGRRQGRDARRWRRASARGATRRGRRGDRGARRRLYDRRGHRHQHRRHGPHGRAHPLRRGPLPGGGRPRRPVADHRRDRLPGDPPRTFVRPRAHPTSTAAASA